MVMAILTAILISLVTPLCIIILLFYYGGCWEDQAKWIEVSEVALLYLVAVVGFVWTAWRLVFHKRRE